MDAESLSCLLFVAGATLCALPCERVTRVTSIDEGATARVLDVRRLGLGEPGPSQPARLLWLTNERSVSALPIGSSCKLLVVAAADIFPLPARYCRLTPFLALLRAGSRTALLLEPGLLQHAPPT